MPTFTTPEFETEYAKLNLEQKLAVDTLEGPVMVIAGAGTGKTQTIALRIANILRQTQTPPSSILCLTFTDSAVTAMRQRLLSIIGPLAYSVRVHTFHSFCNEVIQSHPDFFIFAPDVQSLDELEKIDIVNRLIDDLPDGALLKPWGDHYFYQRDIIGNLQTLKRENITPQKLNSLILEEASFLEKSLALSTQLKSLRLNKNLESEVLGILDACLNLPDISSSIKSVIAYHQSLYQSGGYEVGAAKNPAINLKNAFLHYLETMAKDLPKQQELLTLYEGYQGALKDRARYDFDDMILFVLKAFQDNQDLLREYQEKFQYLLIDEFQDTNSAQNQILDLLGSYFDRPNLFVVGDDDQSIFRFQGASIENVYDFYLKYKTEPIVLKNNYRSHQLILDTSTSVINRNQNRIANFIKNIDKSLHSVSTLDADPINLIVAQTPIEENYFVVKKIKELLARGVKPKEIAVLYRNNADISDLSEVLNHDNIKYYLPVEQNILESRHIRQLINLLEFINDPTRDDLVYHLLASDFINLNSLDLLALMRYSRTQHLPFSQLISDPQKLAEVTPSLKPNTLRKLRNFSRRLAISRRWLENYPLDRFFNSAIRRFQFLKYCLAKNDTQTLNHLLAFYTDLKKSALEKNFDLTQYLNRLQLLTNNQLVIPASPLTANLEDSIQLLTVHRAKGLEFAHVFLFKVVDKKWGNNRSYSHLHLPPGILRYGITSENSDQNEDERRLFYVALTRAKQQIYLSYSAKTDSNRDQLPSIFISEIDPHLIESLPLPADLQQSAIRQQFPEISTHYLTSTFTDYLKNYLTTDYIFNVTHLNSYLRCPFCFYHQTILRIPAVKDKFSSLGTAVHHALTYLYHHPQNSLTDFLADYTAALKKEGLSSVDYQESLNRGTKILSEYYDFYHTDLCPQIITDYDFKSTNLHLGDIPLTGKIDLIEILNEQQINVVDFKTGNPDSKSQELSPNGDYFRQLTFYQLLISLDPSFKQQLNSGIIDFVQKSKLKNSFIRREIKITPQNVADLKNQITDIYQKIINLDFFHLGTDCKDHLHIHYLLK